MSEATAKNQKLTQANDLLESRMRKESTLTLIGNSEIFQLDVQVLHLNADLDCGCQQNSWILTKIQISSNISAFIVNLRFQEKSGIPATILDVRKNIGFGRKSRISAKISSVSEILGRYVDLKWSSYGYEY